MTKITVIDSANFEYPQYKEGDEQTILPISVNSTFTTEKGRVESFVYDLAGNLLNYNSNAEYSIIENGIKGNKNMADALLVYPEKEIENLGLEIGSYNVYFNFLNNELGSSIDQPFSLKQISANRLELRLTTAFIEPEDLNEEISKIFPDTITSPSYPDFYVNFGQNRLSIANNILFDNTNNQYSVLIKLYEPLPSYAEERDALWVTTKQRDSIAYNVEFEPPTVLPTPKKNVLKGPNFSLSLNNQVHSTIKPTSFEDLENLTGITTSSRNQLNSLLEEKGIQINIDYSDLNNFINFSSALKRVNNFYYKVGLIESASNSLDVEPTGSGVYISSSKASTQQKISSIIENFDGFEYWMYYTSGTYSANTFPRPFPKDTSSPPYTLVSTGSAKALTWLASGVSTSSLYDNENKDNLINTIPVYLLEDSSNEPYRKFIEMTGQHFDTLFTYAQDITNRYNADNRLDFGISKDLVGEAIKSMGINLYTGNFTSYDLVDSLVGTRIPSESVDGQTNITNYVTASDDVLPVEDVNGEIYKRIYHNLPLLLKQKGSIAGVRSLITCFGIPKEILDIKEFNVDYKFTTQSAPNIGESGSVLFNSESIILPPSRSGYIPSTLLSPSVRVQQHYVKSESYNRSLQYTEVGFSPQGKLDESDLSNFEPLGGDFPDFNDFYLGSNRNYYNSKFIDDGVNPIITQTATWDFSAYIRYIKFFDSSLFNMIKDFIPVRTSTATGVIIKPTIKERQRQRPAQLTYQNLTYSGSADTLYYDWNGEKYIYKAIGNYDARLKTGSFEWAGWTGGGWNNSNQVQFSGEIDWSGRDLSTPITGLTQSWTENVYTKMGYAQQYLQTSSKILPNSTHSITHTTQDEFYNGVFKQTGQLDIYDGYLNREYAPQTGVGLIKTDNNNDNPYKKPSDNTFPSLTLGHVTSLPGFVTGTTDVIYLANSAIQIIYIKVSTIDGGNEDLLLANGNIITFVRTNGEIITFHVGAPNIVTNVSGQYVAWEVSSVSQGNPGSPGFLDDTTTTYVAAFDPSIQDTQPGPWAYNDYNPLINNSTDPGAGLVNYNGIRKSVFFMDADYSPSALNSITPINVVALLSSSAANAPVQDSYYASRWWNNSRYLGKQASSPDFNKKIIKVTPDLAGLATSKLLGGLDPSINKPSPDLPQEGGR